MRIVAACVLAGVMTATVRARADEQRADNVERYGAGYPSGGCAWARRQCAKLDCVAECELAGGRFFAEPEPFGPSAVDDDTTLLELIAEASSAKVARYRFDHDGVSSVVLVFTRAEGERAMTAVRERLGAPTAEARRRWRKIETWRGQNAQVNVDADRAVVVIDYARGGM